MPRPREFVFGDRLLDWSATLPWWLNCIVAACVLALLQGHNLGTGYQDDPFDLAAYGRYAVPLLFLLIAAASLWRRQQRGRLLRQAEDSTASGGLSGMSRLEFKQLVAEAFRRQGYEVEAMDADALEDGMDLVLWKNDHKSLVQCKPWSTYPVGVEVVRELTGFMHAVGASSAYLVTSGGFSRPARHFASGQSITLIDGPALCDLIAGLRTHRPDTMPGPMAMPHRAAGSGPLAARPNEVVPPLPAAALLALAQAREAVIPACPRCGKAMQRQTARGGNHDGRMFWGCTAFPGCRGVRDLLQPPGR